MSAHTLARVFVDALSARDWTALARVLTPDVGLREYTSDHLRVLRGFEKLVAHFQAEVDTYPDLSAELLSAVGDDERAAVEYRVQYTLDGRYVEEYRAAFLQLRDGQAHTLDVYRTAPQPSAHRRGWIAPPTVTPEEIVRIFDEGQYGWDLRDPLAPTANAWRGLRGRYFWSNDPHPGSNITAGFRWPAAVADAKIEEMIERYRSRGLGFTWFVSPFDEPADLAERLERHGLILAGDQVGMARVGLDPVDIPVNPRVAIEVIEPTRDDQIEAMYRIVATCFNFTLEQTEQRRAGHFERYRNPKTYENEINYLARVDGEPVGEAALWFGLGIAYLGGASVLPQYRNQKIYSTLLARRLRDAHERGYHVATIHAEPMSRRVVARYGFQPYARFLIYAWMPEPDLDVIRSLVPQD
jgi:predicted N-acetyltransferase YhbS